MNFEINRCFLTQNISMFRILKNNAQFFLLQHFAVGIEVKIPFCGFFFARKRITSQNYIFKLVFSELRL